MKEIILLIIAVAVVVFCVVRVVPMAVTKTETSMIRVQEQRDLEEVKKRVERMKKTNAMGK